MNPVLNMRLCKISFPYGAKYPNTEFFKERGIAGKSHTGVDIAPKWGHKSKTFYLRAPVSGRVKFSGMDKGWGFHIKIDSGLSDQPACHILAHMSKGFVDPGQYVKKGQVVGMMGNTGCSTSKHLHYEVRKPNDKGKWVSIDPSVYLT